MDPDDRDELERLMAAMAAGDHSAALTLADRFGRHLAAAICRHLRDLHRDDVARDGDEVDSLVIDVALFLAERAASWSADGGALPWTWADRGIRSLVVAHVGHAQTDAGPDELEQVLVTSGDGAPDATREADGGGVAGFERLADADSTVGLLRAAIGEAAPRARDAAVHVEYQLQKRSGDPSPANTVGALFDLTPANVRQIDRRVRQRMLRLVDDEPAFLPLRDLAWLGARRSSDTDRDEEAA